jgi:putative transposase
MFVLSTFYQLIRSLFVPRLVLITENLALRQQLLVLRRSTNRPRLHNRDRLFWIALSQLWQEWRSILLIVKPETVIKWHRQGFKCYWRWKSRSGRVGRPKINEEVRLLIRRMSRENPTWGVPRIQAELHLLGYEVAESMTFNILYGFVVLLHGQEASGPFQCDGPSDCRVVRTADR